MKKIFFFIIFLIALGYRTLALDKAPSSLSNDEISIAYDSYSILNTKKDEHGIFMPLSFKSHATYKAPLTTYLGVIPNYFFGNSEFSARITSALLGSFSVFLIGLLAMNITKSLTTGYIASFVLALTPWHIYSSRMALESNIALFFVIAGIYMFMLFLDKKSWYKLILSAILFGLSIWSYHTEWLLVPMLLISTMAIFKKDLSRKQWFMFIGVFSIVCIPIFFDFLSRLGTSARANTEMFYREVHVEKILKDPNSSTISKLKVALIPLANYLDYVNLKNIFYSGLSILGSKYLFLPGLLFAVWLPYLFLGTYTSFVKVHTNKKLSFVFVLLFLCPVVPALTQGGVNAVRFIPIMLPLVVLISIGINSFFVSKKNKMLKILTLVFFGIQLFYFTYNYFIVFPNVNAIGYQYGYRQTADYINKHGEKYNKIVIHELFGPYDSYIGVPHLYISYFTNANPNVLQKRIGSEDGFLVDKNLFKTIEWSKEIIKPKRLYFSSLWNTPDTEKLGLKKIDEIKYPNGDVFFNVYESR